MNTDQQPAVVIAGGSGFVGRAVTEALATDGYATRQIGRNAPVRWEDAAALTRAVDGADLVINLAGKSVNCRYTDRNRAGILNSRVETTRALREAIATAERPPRVWMNASTATIYRHSPPHRRYRGIGEDPTSPARAPWYRTRGRQRFSWVHIDDVVAAVRFIRDEPRLSGPVNIASPHPSENSTLMRSLRSVVGAPVGLPTQRWMLEAGMWMLRTEPELVMKSRWVVPLALCDAGFTFEHPDLRSALVDAKEKIDAG